MTKNALLESSITHPSSGDAAAPRRVADLVRQCSALDGRYVYRVSTRGASGRIFFEAGRVAYAEFGEDWGLPAVVEMLRAGPVTVELVHSSWPVQTSLHLSADLLLSMLDRDASTVVRKIDLPATPPPLPDPAPPPPSHRAPTSRVARPESSPPVRSGGPGAGVRRLSGVMPRAAGESEAATAAALPARPAAIVTRAQRGSAARALRVARASKTATPSAPPAGGAGAPSSPRAAAASTTAMVRITTRGELLAARGKNAEQLAEAAAFIHGLASLIAADFGRHGRANVHLSGKGTSLLVARSEVNDIGAALGRTERLSSLIGKLGLK